MRISFSPQRRDDVLSVSKQGDVLTINGEDYDFSSVPDGATIPAGEVPCSWIVGPVERLDGDLHLTLILPHGPNPPAEVAFPGPLTDPADGEIDLPQGSDPIPHAPAVRTEEEFRADLAAYQPFQDIGATETYYDLEDGDDVDA